MLGVYLVMMLGKDGYARWYGSSRSRRKQVAEKRVHLRLASARASLDAGDPKGMAEQCGAALIGIACDASNRSEIGCTLAEALDWVRQLNVSPELVRRFAQLIEEFDAIRFGVVGKADGQLVDKTDEVARQLVHAFRERKLLS